MINYLITAFCVAVTTVNAFSQETYDFSNVNVVSGVQLDSLSSDSIMVWQLQIDSLSTNDFHYTFFITDTLQVPLVFFDADPGFLSGCSCVSGDQLLFTLPAFSPGTYFLVVAAQYSSDMYAGDKRYTITF